MSRKFEQSFKLLLGRSAKKLTFGALGLAFIFSILRGTLIYFGEMAFASVMLLVSRNRALNLRRILAISSLTVAIVAMMELVLFRPPFSLFLMVPSITSLILLSLSPESYVYVVPFIASSIIYSKISIKAAIGSFILFGALLTVKFVAKKLAYGEDPFLLFSTFIQSLFGDSNSFENVLEKFSEEKNLEIPIYRIDGSPPLLLLVSNIHPGPFKNISGAKLVKALKKKVEELGYELIFLHGVGGHENDPVSFNEVKRVVNSIETAIESEDWNYCDGEGIEPFLIEKGDVEIVGLGFEKCPPLLLISRKNNSMDDIPEDVFKKLGNVQGILVDSQNKFDGEIVWDEKVIEDLRSLLENIPKTKCVPKIGFSSIAQSKVDPFGWEVGPLGLRVLTIECDRKKGALIVIDGNNMKGEVRKYLEDVAKKSGYDVVVIATTDNHENTGGAKGRGYRVVGETIPLSLLVDKILEALEKSEKSATNRRVEFNVLKIRLKVMGKEGFELFQRIVNRTKYFEVLLSIYFLFALAISLLF